MIASAFQASATADLTHLPPSLHFLLPSRRFATAEHPATADCSVANSYSTIIINLRRYFYKQIVLTDATKIILCFVCKVVTN